MKTVSQSYVKRLFWIAMLPYVLAGGFFLSSAAYNKYQEGTEAQEEMQVMASPNVFAPEDIQSVEPFIGQVIMFAGNFAPRGWAFCDGALLPISANSALFSILGTTYGGDGRTSFALPDLRGRVAVHPGRGPGLTERRLGSKFGSETISFQGRGKAVSVGDKGLAEQKVPSVMQPSLGINFIIALQGTYPSRN